MKKLNKYNKYLVKRIIILNAGSLLTLLITYLLLIFFLSHVNSFWDIFRGKDSYEERDTIPPISPYLEPVPEAIKADKININGKTEAGIKVQAIVDGSDFAEIVSDNDGYFTFADIPVSYAPTKISVISIDQAGNKSSSSREYTIVRDDKEPELEVTAPKKGEVYRATERTYAVTGKTDPSSTVIVNGVTTLADTAGEFSAQIALRDGSNEIVIAITDKAGNQKEEKVYMTYEKIQ